MNHDLVGYLLKALDADEYRSVEAHLRDTPEAAKQLEKLRRRLDFLAGDAADAEPPEGLWVQAIATVAEYKCRNLPFAPAPRSERASGGRGWWRRADVLVAAALLLIVGGLGTVWLVGMRDRERRTLCESNLRQFYTALKAYSESDPEGRFPQVAAQGPTSIAGIFVPLLRDKELLPPGQPGECCDLPEKTRPRSVEELRQLYSERPEEFAQAARTLGGCYAYTLGYRDGDAHRGLKKDMPEGLPLMSDRPPAPTAPEFLSGGNSPNHGGKGQNVLTLGGVVAFHTTRAAGIQGDDIFTNRDRIVAAGLDRNDSVLGRSDARPYQSGRDE